MKALNEYWVVWRRHCDDQSGILKFNGQVVHAIEALQRAWAKRGKRTGCSYRVVVGGLVDALCESTKI